MDLTHSHLGLLTRHLGHLKPPRTFLTRHLFIDGHLLPSDIEDTPDSFWGRGYCGKGQNNLGVLHQSLASSCFQVLVAGSSHAGGMDTYLRQALVQDTSRLLFVDTLCLPGCSVEQLQDKLSHMSLTQYHGVILMVGGCSLYNKQAQRLSPPADVVCQLESLCLKVGSLTTGHVLLSSILLKACPVTRDQYVASAKFNLGAYQVQIFNNSAAYVNRKILCINYPKLSTIYGGCRLVDPSFYRDDCVHLNETGKELVCHTWRQILLKFI